MKGYNSLACNISINVTFDRALRPVKVLKFTQSYAASEFSKHECTYI